MASTFKWHIRNRSDISRQAIIRSALLTVDRLHEPSFEKAIRPPQINLVKLTRIFQPQCKQFGEVNIIRLFINHYKPAELGQYVVSKTGPIALARSDEIQFKKEVN
jgi:hypothetical protein